MQEQLKSSLLDEGWFIIITLEAIREYIVVIVYIAHSIFVLFDYETFYFMK
jgi:hypothetical protein